VKPGWIMTKFVLNGYQTIISIGELNKSDGVTKFSKESINLTNIKENTISNRNSIEYFNIIFLISVFTGLQMIIIVGFCMG